MHFLYEDLSFTDIGFYFFFFIKPIVDFFLLVVEDCRVEDEDQGYRSPRRRRRR
jgi:hypothetical protein